MKKILSPMEKLNFPESEELPEGVREIEAEDTFGYCTELYPDVEVCRTQWKEITPSDHDTNSIWTGSEMAIDRICAGFFVAQTEAFSEPSHTGEDVRKRICDRHRRAQRKRAGSISGTGNRRQNSNSFLAFKWTEISY